VQVDRRTVGVVIVGVLGALALAFAAATLTSPAAQGGGSLVSTGDGSPALFQPDETLDPDPGPLPEPGPVLQAILVGLFVFTGMVSVYLLSIRDLVNIVIAVFVAGLAFWLLMALLSALVGPGGDIGSGEDTGAGLPSGSGGFGPLTGEAAPTSPLLLGAIGVVAVLAGLNLGLTYVAWRRPKSCGFARSSAGVLASVPAILSGTACCGPVILLALGIQASGLLVATLQWLLPASILLLVGSLLLVAQRVAPATSASVTETPA